MKKSILITLLALSGCATDPFAYTSQTMLPDGRTWEVKASVPCDDIDNKLDNNLSPAARNKALAGACTERLVTKITKHGVELCGADPQRVFNCGTRGNEDVRGFGSCYVRCPKGD